MSDGRRHGARCQCQHESPAADDSSDAARARECLFAHIDVARSRVLNARDSAPLRTVLRAFERRNDAVPHALESNEDDEQLLVVVQCECRSAARWRV